MSYTQEELKKIFLLIRSQDERNFCLGLELLKNVKLSETLKVGLLWMVVYQPEAAQAQLLDFLAQKRLSVLKIKRIFQTIQLFNVTHRTYRWHSEHSYSTEPEAIQEMLQLYPKIKPAVEELLTWDESFREEYTHLAQALWTYYAMPEANDFLLKALDYQPDKLDFYFYIAQIYQWQNKWDLAIQYFQQYIALLPHHLPDNEYELDEYFMNLRRYPPSTLWAWHELGDIFANQKNDITQAIFCYEQAMALQANNHQTPLDKLADLWQKSGKKPLPEILDLRLKASQVLFTSQAYYRPDLLKIAQRYEHIGDTYFWELDDYNSALSCYKQSLQVLPKQTSVILKQAELVVQFYRDYWQARALYEKILKFDPSNLDAKKGLQIIKNKLNPTIHNP
jgi:tetratricopeptide (TPR) repeat protein